MILSVAVALASHLVFVRFLPAPWQKNESADFRAFYEPVARQLAIGHGFYLPSGRPALKYPPGIPILYGVTFWVSDRLGWTDERGLRVLQASLTLATSVLVAMVALEFSGVRVALLSCVLWSTYPFHLWTSKQPSGEALATFFLLVSVLTFLKWSAHGRAAIAWGSVCGAVVACAALTKPFHIALAAVFVALAWICDVPVSRQRRAQFCLSVVAVFALGVLPWEVWASRAAGHFIPLCRNDVASVVDGLTFGLGRARVQNLPLLPRSVAQVANDFALHRRELASNAQVARLLAVHLRKQPAAVAQLFLTKAVRCWYANDSHRHERWTAVIQLLYLPLFITGAWFVWAQGRQCRNFLVVAVVVGIYYWGMTTIAALAIMRYMLPVTSLLLMLAGNALYFSAEAVAQGAIFVKGKMQAQEPSCSP